MIDRNNNKFWESLDLLVRESNIIIDRPKDSVHPRYPDMVYPVDYGFLEDTSSMDGNGIDIWLGTKENKMIDSILCIIDRFKKDSEIKIIYGCTEQEKELIYNFHNDKYISALMIVRENHL